MLSRLTDLFGVLPGFCFYDDYDGPNAFATTATRLRRADGTVLYGKRHFLNHMASPESPEVVVTATCAHEFGHIVQYKYKLTKQLTDGQATAKRAELNADFFAGYFAGARKLQKPDYPAAVFAATDMIAATSSPTARITVRRTSGPRLWSVGSKWRIGSAAALPTPSRSE